MRTHINFMIVNLVAILITVLSWKTLISIHYALLDELLVVSQNFFVKCSSVNCDSILIPLIGYLLNLNTEYKTFLTLNIFLIFITLCGYLYIIYRFKNSNELLYSDLYVFLSIGFFIFIEVLTPPDIISILFAISGLKLFFRRNKYSYYFLLAPLLISPTNWAIEYSFLIIVLLFISHLKIQKKLFISLAKICMAGLLITQLYLFLVEYNNSWTFFSTTGLKEKLIFPKFITYALLLCTIGILWIYYFSKKNSNMNILLLAGINTAVLISCIFLPNVLNIIPIALITSTYFVSLNDQLIKK